MGGIYPGLSLQGLALTTDHQPLLSGGSAVQGQGGGTLTWSVAVHRVSWPWGFLGGAGQGQPQPVFLLEPPYLSYEAI